MKRVPCRGPNCKKEVLWADLPSGGRIPLDPSAPVYLLRGGKAIRTVEHFVSHFATCVDSGKFPGSAPKPDQEDTLL